MSPDLNSIMDEHDGTLGISGEHRLRGWMRVRPYGLRRQEVEHPRTRVRQCVPQYTICVSSAPSAREARRPSGALGGDFLFPCAR